MIGVRGLTERNVDRSASILVLAMEAVSRKDFFAGNGNGFSAAWVTGHLACFLDLFSSWFDGELIFDAAFHGVFNETAATAPSPGSKADSVDPGAYPKELLLFRFRQAVIKALDALEKFDPGQWEGPPPPAAPVSMRAAGDVWEDIGVHIWWHLGELAGSMPAFAGTYTLNIRPHHFYRPPDAAARLAAVMPGMVV